MLIVFCAREPSPPKLEIIGGASHHIRPKMSQVQEVSDYHFRWYGLPSYRYRFSSVTWSRGSLRCLQCAKDRREVNECSQDAAGPSAKFRDFCLNLQHSLRRD